MYEFNQLYPVRKSYLNNLPERQSTEKTIKHNSETSGGNHIHHSVYIYRESHLVRGYLENDSWYEGWGSLLKIMPSSPIRYYITKCQYMAFDKPWCFKQEPNNYGHTV